MYNVAGRCSSVVFRHLCTHGGNRRRTGVVSFTVVGWGRRTINYAWEISVEESIRLWLIHRCGVTLRSSVSRGKLNRAICPIYCRHGQVTTESLCVVACPVGVVCSVSGATQGKLVEVLDMLTIGMPNPIAGKSKRS